jgi:hypothetical protein
VNYLKEEQDRGVARSLEKEGCNFENLDISKAGESQCPFLYIK